VGSVLLVFWAGISPPLGRKDCLPFPYADIFVVAYRRRDPMKKSKLLLFLFVPAFLACGNEIQITDIHVALGEDGLLLSLTIPNTLVRDLRNAIEIGTKVTYTYVIGFYEVRGFWWDERISRVQVRHGMAYDNLKQVYLVTLSELNNRTISLKDFADAERLMSEIVDLRVAELHEMTKGRRYRLRIVAELERGRPSSILDDVISFLPSERLRNGSCTLTFRY
jgi:hypothetical protein